MKNLKTVTYTFISFAVFAVCAVYCFVLFAMPPILNSDKNLIKFENFLENKTGVPIDIIGFEFSVNPALNIQIRAGSANGADGNIHLKDISYDANLLCLKKANLFIGSGFVDIGKLRGQIKHPEKKNKILKLSYIPAINTGKIYLKINDKSHVNIDYVKSVRNGSQIEAQLYGKAELQKLNSPLYFGESGFVIYKNGLVFDNFSIRLNKSTLILSNELENIAIKGHNLPAKELSEAFLYYYKHKHPNKKNFMENFYEIEGYIDVDLTVKNLYFYGTCTAKGLKALFFDYKIPIGLPLTVFHFSGKEIDARTSGTFGAEPAKTDFHLTGLATKDVIATGSVSSPLTDKITKKYFPTVRINGVANALVKYKTQNETVDIDYSLILPKGNYLTLKRGSSKFSDKYKKIDAHTRKVGDRIDLTDFNYSVAENGHELKLLSASGVFEKQGKYRPVKINAKTNGKITVNAISPVAGRLLQDGTFEADLTYDFPNDDLRGNMRFYDIKHKDFIYLKKVDIEAQENVELKAEGTFFCSPMNLNANAVNDFKNNITINNIDVHLNDFSVHKGKIINKISSPKPAKPRRYDIIVKRGHARVDRIYGSKFSVTDVDIIAQLKNKVADFVIPQAKYAKGILSAKGKYDMNDYSSDIEFSASDIDSDEVATNFFKLPDLVEGSAYATLHLKTKNKLNDIKADATFAIKDGYLPDIGSREFIIDASKSSRKTKTVFRRFLKDKVNFKFKLTDIVHNLDFSKENAFRSNLHGSFKVHNEEVKDAKVFSKSNYLSLFIAGDYDIETENGNLDIWGRRNKTAAKKIRIFRIPLNLLYKLVFRAEHSIDSYTEEIKLIPEIKTKPGDHITIFRISVKGNLNRKDKLKVILKDLR